MSKSQLGQWVSTSLTFLAVGVALFKEELQRLWRRPKLEVSVKTMPPDCNISKTTYTYSDPQTGAIRIDEGNCYYLRFLVHNYGNVPATNVQVYASKLLYEVNPNTFNRVNTFISMNFKWSHTSEIFRERIAPKMNRHCDLGHISDPQLTHIHHETLPDLPNNTTVLFLSLEVQPYTLIHMLKPGNYKLELLIAGDNVPPIKRIMNINHTGKWFDKEINMFSDEGIKLELEKSGNKALRELIRIRITEPLAQLIRTRHNQ
jgi:hypothetical protein